MTLTITAQAYVDSPWWEIKICGVYHVKDKNNERVIALAKVDNLKSSREEKTEKLDSLSREENLESLDTSPREEKIERLDSPIAIKNMEMKTASKIKISNTVTVEIENESIPVETFIASNNALFNERLEQLTKMQNAVCLYDINRSNIRQPLAVKKENIVKPHRVCCQFFQAFDPSNQTKEAASSRSRENESRENESRDNPCSRLMAWRVSGKGSVA